MIDFPKLLLPQYLNLLEKRGVPTANFAECIKWGRYFLDYCDKYPASVSHAKQLTLFIDKLKAKKQSELQCRQAAYAVSVFIAVQKIDALLLQQGESAESKQDSVSTQLNMPKQRASQYSVVGYQEKSSSPHWDEIIAKMAGEIKVRHYPLRAGQDDERTEKPAGFLTGLLY